MAVARVALVDPTTGRFDDSHTPQAALTAATTAQGAATTAQGAAAQATAAAASVSTSLADAADTDGSPFRVALTRSGRKPRGRGEETLFWDDYNPVVGSGTGGNIAANNSAMNFLLADIAAIGSLVYSDKVSVRVVFGAGMWRLSQGFIPDRRVTVEGQGSYSTLFLRAPDMVGDVFRLDHRNSRIANLGIDGRWTNDSPGFTQAGDLVVVNGAYGKQENLLLLNAPRDGLSLGRDATSINNKAYGIDIRDSKRYGLRTNPGTESTDMELMNVNVGRSGLSGFSLAAASTVLSLCHSWGNGIHDPADTAIDRAGYTSLTTGIRFVMCESETNIGPGIALRSGAHRNQIVGGKLWGNRVNGVYVTGANDGLITGALLERNGVINTGGTSGASFAGMELNNATGWSVTGNKGFDNGTLLDAATYPYPVVTPFSGKTTAVLTQSRHFYETGTSDFNIVSGNSFRSTQARNGVGYTVSGANTLHTGLNIT